MYQMKSTEIQSWQAQHLTRELLALSSPNLNIYLSILNQFDSLKFDVSFIKEIPYFYLVLAKIKVQYLSENTKPSSESKRVSLFNL